VAFVERVKGLVELGATHFRQCALKVLRVVATPVAKCCLTACRWFLGDNTTGAASSGR
jgi:hypothetical protein